MVPESQVQFLKNEEFFFDLIILTKKISLKFLARVYLQKTKTWIKWTVNPEPLATFEQFKDAILLAFPRTNVKWVMKRKLYAEIQKDNEAQLDFVLQKLEYVENLDLPTRQKGKFNLSKDASINARTICKSKAVSGG